MKCHNLIVVKWNKTLRWLFNWMDSDSSDDTTPYQHLLSSVKRPLEEGSVKKRKKGVKPLQKSKRMKRDVITLCDEEISQSDSEDVSDPYYENLNYQLTEDDITLLQTPSKPQIFPGHPLGNATLFPSPLPTCTPYTDGHIHLKKKILTRLCALKTSEDTLTPQDTLTATQRHLLSLLGQYSDVLYARETHERHMEVLEAVVAHLVSHVCKGRRLVLRNNQVSKVAENEPPRDQGLVRPRVLILLPFRSSALRVVRLMGQLCGGVTHGKRLEEEFGTDATSDPTKPPEYRQLFDGNTDDCFKMGVALYSKTLRLFAPFYASDIILASPLGLRRLIGAEGEGKREVDFLSSLEVVFLDQTEVFLMQNWSHVVSLLSATHLQPRAMHGTDIRRVRSWALDQLGKFYCQLIVCSQIMTPEIHSLFHSHATSRHHKMVLTPMEYPGVLRHIRHQPPQVFKRLPVCPHSDTSDQRFSFFRDNLLPDHLSALKRRTLVFTPSYCDYLRVRNHLREQEVAFTHICEYSATSQARRATSLFSQGERDILLLTERLIFFKSPRLPSVLHLILFAPPTFPHVYTQLVNSVAEDTSATVTCIYAREDAISLRRMVGPEQTNTLLTSKSSTHLIM